MIFKVIKRNKMYYFLRKEMSNNETKSKKHLNEIQKKT